MNSKFIGVPKKQSNLQLVQDALWLLLVILVPLWVNLWGKQPFELPKVMLMRSLVWLLASLVAGEYIFSRRTLRLSPILLPTALLAVVIVATTAMAVNWRLSLWGSYERGQGAVTLLSYLLLFLLAVAGMRSFRRVRRVIAAMAAVGAPLALFGAANFFGWNPFNLVSDARAPIYATLGRANFTGAYLAILTPLLLALALTAPRRVWRFGWAILLGGSLAVIGLTLARGAWLAAAVSLGMFAALWRGTVIPPRRWVWGGVGLLLLGILSFAVRWGLPHSDSVTARLLIWRHTLSLIFERPLLGYGADSLRSVFPRVFPPELVYYQGRDFFVDRAHNFLLDWAVTIGIPGLLAVIFIFSLFFVTIGRALRRQPAPEKRALLIAILAAVAGNLANNSVSFDVTPTATAMWLLMGMGIALASPSDAQPNMVTRRTLWQWGTFGAVLLGVGAAIWLFNGRPLLADSAARTADRFALRGNWAQAIAAEERATNLWAVEPAYHLSLNRFYLSQALSNPATAQPSLARAESALRMAQQLQPENPVVWLQSAQFYDVSARRFGSDTQSLADDAFRRASALAPNNAAIFTAWGRFQLENGNPAQAAPLLRQAVRLDASNGETYLYLGAAESALGRVEIAIADYREAIRIMPESAQAYTGLANGYWQLNRRDEALQSATEALRLDPQNSPAQAIRQAIFNAP